MLEDIDPLLLLSTFSFEGPGEASADEGERLASTRGIFGQAFRDRPPGSLALRVEVLVAARRR